MHCGEKKIHIILYRQYNFFHCMYLWASEYFVNPNKTSADYFANNHWFLFATFLGQCIFCQKGVMTRSNFYASPNCDFSIRQNRADSFSKTYLSKNQNILCFTKVNFTWKFLNCSIFFFTGLEVQARNSNGTGQGQKRTHFQKLLQPHGKIHCRHHHPWGYHDLEQFSWNISNKWDKDKFFSFTLVN